MFQTSFILLICTLAYIVCMRVIHQVLNSFTYTYHIHLTTWKGLHLCLCVAALVLRSSLWIGFGAKIVPEPWVTTRRFRQRIMADQHVLDFAEHLKARGQHAVAAIAAWDADPYNGEYC